MTTRLKVLLSILIILTSYAIGRWSSPEKVKIETHTVEVEKKQDEEVSKDHKITTIVVTTHIDGTKTTTTTIADDKYTDDKSSDVVHSTTDTEKETTYSSSKTTVSALVGVNLTKAALPDYGLGVSKPVLGPVTIGVFGFKSGEIGASVGLTF